MSASYTAALLKMRVLAAHSQSRLGPAARLRASRRRGAAAREHDRRVRPRPVARRRWSRVRRPPLARRRRRRPPRRHARSARRTAQGPMQRVHRGRTRARRCGLLVHSRCHGRPPPAFPFRGRGIGIPRLRDVLRRYRRAASSSSSRRRIRSSRTAPIDEIRAADARRSRRARILHGTRAAAARAYEPRIPTGAAREETRGRCTARGSAGRSAAPGYREFQVPERSGSTVIVTPRFVAHAHRAGLPVKSGPSTIRATCSGCSIGASTA